MIPCPACDSLCLRENTGALPILLFLAALTLSIPSLGQPIDRPKTSDLPPEFSMPIPELERRVWNKLPIQVVLPINRERLVTFNVPVRVDLPPDLDATTLRTQIVADTNSGTIYWTALKPFGSHRIQVQDIVSKNIYLLDLTSSTDARDTTRLEVTVPGTNSPETNPTPASTSQQGFDVAEPDPVILTRMAAQHLYAPERLLQVPDGVFRTPVRQTSTDALFHGAKVEATPIVAWRSGELTVTAVKLKNLNAAELILDPRTLRGHWQTATFQHNLLKPQGTARDTTAAYLISTTPFEEVLGGHQ